MSTIPPTITWKNERLQRLNYCNLYNDIKYLKTHCQLGSSKSGLPGPPGPPGPPGNQNIAQVLQNGNNALATTSLFQSRYKLSSASNYIYNLIGYGVAPINPSTTPIPAGVPSTNKFTSVDEYGDLLIHDGIYWNGSSQKNLPFGYSDTTLQNNVINFTWDNPIPTTNPSICTLLLNNNFNIQHDNSGNTTNIILRKIFFYFNFYSCQNDAVTTTYTFPTLTQNSYINLDYSEVITNQNGNVNVGRPYITVDLNCTNTGGTAIITIYPTDLTSPIPVVSAGSNGNISMNCRIGMTPPCNCNLSYIS